MAKIHLWTTRREFEDMHTALDSVRESTPTVKVNQQALRNLLMDHSKMVGALAGKVEEDDHRDR